jgi:hypothetical protein
MLKGARVHMGFYPSHVTQSGNRWEKAIFADFRGQYTHFCGFPGISGDSTPISVILCGLL